MLLAKEMGAKSLMAKSDSLLVTWQVKGEYQAKETLRTVIQDGPYLQYFQILKETFAVFKLVHVPREQNAQADLLAKLASSRKGGRQMTFIQKTLRTPQTTTNVTTEVQHISTIEGVKRSHRSLTQETLKTHRISTYALSGEGLMQVCLVEGGKTWMTPYQRYLEDGILPNKTSSTKCFKCLGFGHISANYPNKRTMIVKGGLVVSDRSDQSSRSTSPTSLKTSSEDECEITCEGDLLVVRRMLGTIQKSSDLSGPTVIMGHVSWAPQTV